MHFAPLRGAFLLVTLRDTVVAVSLLIWRQITMKDDKKIAEVENRLLDLIEFNIQMCKANQDFSFDFNYDNVITLLEQVKTTMKKTVKMISFKRDEVTKQC